MKKNFISKIVVVALIVAGGLWVTAPSIAPDNCIHVSINYGVLDNQAKVNKCVNANSTMLATDVFNYAGIDVVGTEKYGNAVVCRVDGKPSSNSSIGIKGHEGYLESCKDMPAEFAYWAVFIKQHKNVNIPLDFTTGWKWAETGFNQIKLSPGDSINLVFADNENVSIPNE